MGQGYSARCESAWRTIQRCNATVSVSRSSVASPRFLLRCKKPLARQVFACNATHFPKRQGQTMVTAIEPILQTRLINQRHRLEAAAGFPRTDEITKLLEGVDAALRRMDDGIYGICEVCHEPIEAEVLLSDPVSRFCLGDLTPKEQQALENDLQLAAQIQRGLLPQSKQTIHGWQVAYHYQPAGVVSGDYCDFIDGDNESLHFVLGDVSGN